MTIYLTIITTILVATQIIRVTQNAMQLRKHSDTDKRNEYVLSIYKQLEVALCKYLKG